MRRWPTAGRSSTSTAQTERTPRYQEAGRYGHRPGQALILVLPVASRSVQRGHPWRVVAQERRLGCLSASGSVASSTSRVGGRTRSCLSSTKFEDNALGPSPDRGVGGPLHRRFRANRTRLRRSNRGRYRDTSIQVEDVNETDAERNGDVPSTMKVVRRISAVTWQRSTRVLITHLVDRCRLGPCGGRPVAPLRSASAIRCARA
jgi:hypothetical protein